jgi:hypothetical protein
MFQKEYNIVSLICIALLINHYLFTNSFTKACPRHVLIILSVFIIGDGIKVLGNKLLDYITRMIY